MKKLIALIAAAVLIAGCTAQSSGNVDISGLEELGELPSTNSSGMPELGSLPSTNSTIDLDTGLIESNPFPEMPNLE